MTTIIGGRHRLALNITASTLALALVGGCSAAHAGTAEPARAATTVTAVSAPHDAYYNVIGAPGWGYQATCDTGIRGVSSKTGAPLDGGQFVAFGSTAPKTTYPGVFRKGVLILAAGWCSDISPKLTLQTLVAPAGFAAPVEQLPISVGGTGASQILGLTPSADVHAQYLIALGAISADGKPIDSTLSSASSSVQPSHRYGATSAIADPNQVVGYAGPAAFIKYAVGTDAVDGVTETLQATGKPDIAITLKNSTSGSEDLPVVTSGGEKLPVIAERPDAKDYPKKPASSYADAVFTADGLLTSVTVVLQ